jgi:hypothetical protein
VLAEEVVYAKFRILDIVLHILVEITAMVEILPFRRTRLYRGRKYAVSVTQISGRISKTLKLAGPIECTPSPFQFRRLDVARLVYRNTVVIACLPLYHCRDR